MLHSFTIISTGGEFMERDEKKMENLFDITLINDDEDISAIKAQPTCQDCFIDFVSCDPTKQDDDCSINYA